MSRNAFKVEERRMVTLKLSPDMQNGQIWASIDSKARTVLDTSCLAGREGSAAREILLEQRYREMVACASDERVEREMKG